MLARTLLVCFLFAIKDTLVPLRTNFNANGSVRWCTSLYLNLFHWPMGKNSGNGNGVRSSIVLDLTKLIQFLRMGILDVLLSFGSGTSIHALTFIADTKGSAIKRIIWSFFFISAMIYACHQLRIAIICT